MIISLPEIRYGNGRAQTCTPANRAPFRNVNWLLNMNSLSTASRAILWNVSSIHNVILMYSCFVASLLVAGAGLVGRLELWAGGRPDASRSGGWVERTLLLTSRLISQRLTNRDKRAKAFHSLIFSGFIILTFTTTMVMLDHDFGIPIYRGSFYLALTVLSDLFGFGVLVGVALAAKRRYLDQPDKLHSRRADSVFLLVIALLVVQGFLLEGLRIHVTNDRWAPFSPIGLATARLFWPLSHNAARILHAVVWWWHSLTVFVGIGLLPYSKLFHIVSSSLNLFFRESYRPKGALSSIGDIEKIMETEEEPSLGLGSLKDYSWKHLLDLDACTSCGRCQDACPAYASGKPLSPKWLILDSRHHMLALHASDAPRSSWLPSIFRRIDATLLKRIFLPRSGVTRNETGEGWTSSGPFRGTNEAVQGSARQLGVSWDQRIAGEVIDPKVFWSCTTCRACVSACPVGIDHIDQIVGNRRNMALMHGEIPSEAQATLRALENRGNPYGDPNTRSAWAKDLDIPVVQPGDEVDYLYWVGCLSAFDQRKQNIARSLVTLMRAAGLSFGILGNQESCTGDPARRLGEENLYQTLAKANVELLRSIRCKYIVANCPHCFNTIKNEYPEFGFGTEGGPQVIHHSQLLKRLVAEHKIALDEGAEAITFHDPCYLGRYNDEYDAPRQPLKAIKGLKIVEMERSREQGFCCGAGGGHFWMDLKQGERVNVMRVNQAAETSATTIATGCPFCHQMMEDGIKLTEREGAMQVKDIAEVLVEHLKVE